VQNVGLATEYQRSEEVQKIVRMLGGIQITPMMEWEPCLLLRIEVAAAQIENPADINLR